jgi:two-component system OmpR family sensor kinase/two-component system sensor histidine kinase BaeS
MKLAVKVLGALALVLIIALASASWLIDRIAGQTYRGYLNQAQQRQLTQLAGQVAALVETGESWTAIQTQLDAAPIMMPGGMMGGTHGQMRGRGGMMMAERTREVLIVAPNDGTPLGTTGTAVGHDQLAVGVPVTVDGQTVALVVPASGGSAVGAMESAVLAQVQTAIFVSAGVAGLVALTLGGLLVWTILRPLRSLRDGVDQIAAGNLAVAVDVRTDDELGELATAFNQMADRLHVQEELRQRLIADVAHELRTPLSVIQGNLQAILDGVYPLSADEVRNVYLESQLLSRLVDDLHELAQAEAGHLTLDRHPFDLTAALNQMAGMIAPLAHARDVTLRVDAPAGLTALADAERIYQVLHNLLGNALRHTPTGGTVSLTAACLRPGFARVAIADTGPGIAAEHLPYVFDRFYRADSSRRRADDATTGAGLGLAIVRALVEAHGGTVGLASAPGAGATFWFDLPLVPSDNAHADARPHN